MRTWHPLESFHWMLGDPEIYKLFRNIFMKVTKESLEMRSSFSELADVDAEIVQSIFLG